MKLCSAEVEIPGYGIIKLNSSVENTEDYFLMAVRKNNKKRNFLFVSQLLGKHIPIEPKTLFGACANLVEGYAKDKGLVANKNKEWHCEEKTLIIGFAETATAMGHAVFDCFSGNCNYVHTTRNKVADYEFAFEFEEEHCHAPEQLFFLQKESWLKDANQIIIVDDEVTTGNTIKNIISRIEEHYPGKSYTIITFLDWRNNENLVIYQQFCKKNNIDISFYSFVQGNIIDVEVKDNEMAEMELSVHKHYDPKRNGWNFHYCGLDPNTKTSAENGMSHEQKIKLHETIDKIANVLTPGLRGKKRAILGTGEFMYIPMRCASKFPYINYFNATTRSPVIAHHEEKYGVKTALHFQCPVDITRNEYLYNSNIMDCDEVVLFLEDAVPQQQLNSLLQALDAKHYQYKHVVFVRENG